MSVHALLDQFALLASAPEGVKRLRELILELAVRGKLMPQDPNDEPASELLKRILIEKARLVAEGEIKKDKPLAEIGEEEWPFGLPEGWKWVRLGEATTFGLTDKSGDIDDSTWVLDLEDIEKDTSVLLQKIRFVDRQAKSDKNRFQVGDVLYGKLRPYLNKVIVADEVGVCTTEILPIRSHGDLIFPPYLMHALKRPDFLAYVNSKSYGMKMPRLGTDDGRKAILPLPPLPEQHRIVAKVDELMALCDRLEAQQTDAAGAHATLVKTLLDTLTQSQTSADFTANWQRLAHHFDTLITTEASITALKQTLLQLAVMGKLVPQDPKDEPASNFVANLQEDRRKEHGQLLLEAISSGERAPRAPKNQFNPLIDCESPDLPMGWCITRVGDVTDCLDYLRIPINKAERLTREGSIPYYGANGQVGWIDTYIFDEDLVLVVEDETFIGRTKPFSYIVRGKSWVNNHAHVLRPLGGITADYLNLCLCRYDFIPLTSGTTGRRKLNQEALIEARFSIAPLSEQHRIVAKIYELMGLCDHLASRLKAARELAAKYANASTETVLEAA